jgi:hypothetical protein
MAILTLAEAKAHLKIAGTDEDEAVSVLLDATEDYLGRIGCPVTADPLPASLKVAALIGVTMLYGQRDRLSVAKDEVADIGSVEFNPIAANRILAGTLDRLVASLREVTV